jgi:hypothetical protein
LSGALSNGATSTPKSATGKTEPGHRKVRRAWALGGHSLPSGKDDHEHETPNTPRHPLPCLGRDCRDVHRLRHRCSTGPERYRGRRYPCNGDRVEHLESEACLAKGAALATATAPKALQEDHDDERANPPLCKMQALPASRHRVFRHTNLQGNHEVAVALQAMRTRMFARAAEGP